eukprot:scaffold3772_cov390-Prasinococcus_capsulatus_cf.AAC.9
MSHGTWPRVPAGTAAPHNYRGSRGYCQVCRPMSATQEAIGCCRAAHGPSRSACPGESSFPGGQGLGGRTTAEVPWKLKQARKRQLSLRRWLKLRCRAFCQVVRDAVGVTGAHVRRERAASPFVWGSLPRNSRTAAQEASHLVEAAGTYIQAGDTRTYLKAGVSTPSTIAPKS